MFPVFWIPNQSTLISNVGSIQGYPKGIGAEMSGSKFPGGGPDMISEEEFSDDELNPVANQTTVEEKPKEKWNIFRTEPPEDETLALEDKKFYQITIRVLKLLTYILVFFLVLASAVSSKLAVVLMTSQLSNGTERELCHSVPLRNWRVRISGDEVIQWHWALYFCFIVPEVATFLRSIRMVWFKGPKKATLLEFLIPLFFETCHTIGMGLFTFYVLPNMNAVEAIMLGSSFCVLPGILKTLSRNPTRYGIGKAMVISFLDVLALLMQLSAFVLWTIVFKDENRMAHYWMYPLSAFLVSFGWWENFVSAESRIGFIRAIGKLRTQLEETRYHSYKFIAPLKILIFLATMCLAIYLRDDPLEDYFERFFSALGKQHTLYASEINETISYPYSKTMILPSEISSVVLTQSSIPEKTYANSFRDALLVQCLITYFCYATAKFACKIRIQGFSFAFPLTLSAPVSIAVLLSMCGARDTDVCYGKSIFPPYLFWNCPSGDFRSTFVESQYGWVWILLLLSQTWIAFHIWYSHAPRLARTETLFCTPFYNALFLDHNLVLNRKRDPHDDPIEHNTPEDEEGSVSDVIETGVSKERILETHPRIVTCATMWHENKDEMCSFFKSVFRLDADQCTRRFVKEKYGLGTSYYEYETHIFFDDAFKKETVNGKTEFVVNDYVKDLMKVIGEAASLVHETNITLSPPIRYPTPYGGRLEWTLPGKTKLYLHLKNKDKIRHRKRWSQCMYMYYLLGFKIAAQEWSLENQEVLAQSTFLLALDGDIDFQPDAVHLLVDRMKINPKLGAACGRIHPIGSGPMVWYQKFEYAIGHWLQKATEHMIGCVLCSPGCFSLFRAAALMDVNVMNKYTTLPSEAKHYVQYDQGEDRWLCTLMLQQGWRVEYCAASDSFTHAPEGFNEFYNQRRRWIPSTMANILDLLMDYKRTIKVNPDISLPYILYQSIMFGGSVLGPGTIFLMLVGAFNAAFKLDNLTCLYLNAIPLGIFIISCYVAKQKTQLIIAQLLSVIYALVMVAVLIALILQVTQDGLFAPSSLFLVAITVSFVVAALVHPLEFDCLIHGIVYYITIPSMYLLLIIYSLFNLNDVSWGTRENPAQAAQEKAENEAQQQQQQQDKKAATPQQQPGGFLAGWIPGLSPAKDNSEGSFEFSCAGLFKLMCCVQQKPKDELEQVLVKIHRDLEKTSTKLDIIEKSVQTNSDLARRGSLVGSLPPSTPVTRGSRDGSGMLRASITQPLLDKEVDDGTESKKSKQLERDDLVNPYWNDDPELGHGKTDFIDSTEVVFWKRMIKQYLEPLLEDKEKLDKIKAELADLRNKTVGAFFMFNAVFVTAMFLLQLNKDKLFFNWPFGGSYNMTFQDPIIFEVKATRLQLEPLGLLFVGFYAIILVVQFFAMLLHRFGTFSHIMASTDVGLFSLAVGSSDNDDGAAQEAETVKFVSRLIRLKAEDSSQENTLRDTAHRRKTMHNLHKQHQKPQINTLDRAIERNFRKQNPEELRRLTRFVPNQQRRRSSAAPQGRRDSEMSRFTSQGPNPQLLNRLGRRVQTMPTDF